MHQGGTVIQPLSELTVESVRWGDWRIHNQNKEHCEGLVGIQSSWPLITQVSGKDEQSRRSPRRAGQRDRVHEGALVSEIPGGAVQRNVCETF